MILEIINLETLFKYTNTLVILYAIIYAIRFIYLTRKDTARKPWEYITYAIIILFFVQGLNFLDIPLKGVVQQILTLILTTLLLAAFIFQDYQMKKRNFETLTRKEFIPIEKK